MTQANTQTKRPDALGRLRFHLSPRSKNKKTGPIPVSTSSRETCPETCPFRKHGCMADYGPLALHWDEVTSGNRGMPWSEFLAAIRALPAGQLWRGNQAGDLWKLGSTVGRAALSQLVDANRGRRGFTYTHHRRTPAVILAMRQATANGFTVNASCHSEAEADAAIANGLRAVFVVPASEARSQWTTADGNRAVVCPAQRTGPAFAGMTCERCRLCQARPQNVAIAFLAHGSGRRKAEAMLGPQPPEAGSHGQP